MPVTDVTDEELLTARDAASFERFYLRHVDAVLAYFSRRTRDPELSADLCAETFAAALASRHRFRPGQAPATAWLFGIGSKKLADAQRRGYAEMRARRRLGMERIELSDTDLARIDRLGEGDEARAWMERLAPEQRDAVRAHVIDERPVRRDRGRAGDVRGSRAQAGQPRAGGDADTDGSASMNQDFVTQLQLQLREAALREERRTPSAQRFVRARRGLPGPAPLAAALAVALLALAVAIGVLQLRDELRAGRAEGDRHVQGRATTCSRSRPAPAPSGRRDPVERPGAAHRPEDAQGHRAHPARAARCRSSPARARVWALVGDLLTAGAQGAVELTRIDPRTNRVVARIPMRSPHGRQLRPARG